MLDVGATVCAKRAQSCADCPLRPCVRVGRPPAGPTPDPAVGSAGAGGRQSTFAGSDRQGRGRLVDALRRGPVALADVAAGRRLARRPGPGPTGWRRASGGRRPGRGLVGGRARLRLPGCGVPGPIAPVRTRPRLPALSRRSGPGAALPSRRVLNVTFHGVRGPAPVPGPGNARYGTHTACVTLEVPKEDPLVLDLGSGLRRWSRSLAAAAATPAE